METTQIFVFLLAVFVLSGADEVQNARTVSNQTLPFRIVFRPSLINQLPMEAEESVQVFFKQTSEIITSDLVLGVQATRPDLVEVTTPVIPLYHIEEFPDSNDTDVTNVTASGNFTVRGLFLGFSNLVFHVCNITSRICGDENVTFPVQDGNQTWVTLDIQFRMSILRPRTFLDDIFLVVVSVLSFISNIAMGCKTDLKVVKKVLKKPIAPLIGFCCQFCLMPPFAFAVGKFLHLTPGEAMGVFTMGSAPGGGASNVYSYLLEGDVSLSVTMTLISTIASLGMLPLWLYTLGRLLIDKLGLGTVEIPFTNILSSLALIVIPVAIGILISYKLPKVARKIAKIIRPFMIFFLVVMFTFGFYVNSYIFRLFTPMILVAGNVLPIMGFLGGGLIAFACRQKWKRIKTISLETGLQNVGVAILVLLYSFPSPDGEMAITGCVAVTCFDAVIPLILVVVYEIRRRRCKKAKEGASDEPEKSVEDGCDKEEPTGDDVSVDDIKLKDGLGAYAMTDLDDKDVCVKPKGDDIPGDEAEKQNGSDCKSESEGKTDDESSTSGLSSEDEKSVLDTDCSNGSSPDEGIDSEEQQGVGEADLDCTTEQSPVELEEETLVENDTLSSSQEQVCGPDTDIISGDGDPNETGMEQGTGAQGIGTNTETQGEVNRGFVEDDSEDTYL